MSSQALCWIDSQLYPASEAKVSVLDHGFLYGDGIFEGIRFYNNNPFRLPLHLKRLRHSATALQIVLPIATTKLEQAISEIIAASPLSEGYLRVIITRGVGKLGINPASCEKPSVIILADELQLVSEAQRQKGARAIISATRKSTPDRLDPRIKSLNYLNSIMARMEANFAGVDEAILLNDRGNIAEGTADNVFVVRDGELATPPVSEGALAGITRATVLELASALAIPTRESILTAYDLYTADECFLTGTGAKLIPLAEVDGRKVKNCPGELFARLSVAFNDLIKKETQ